MKAPAFWYRPLGITGCLLWPLSLAWQVGTAMRTLCADPYRAKIPLICVGNVTVGGAGKTPVALAIGKMFVEQGLKPVFVTRGYGGRIRGVVQVNTMRHTAQDVGDEALLLARVAPTFVGRDRAAAIREAEKIATHVILDDGLQNPHITPNISLLVIDATIGVGNGLVMPAGPLREPLVGALGRTTTVVMVGDTSRSEDGGIPSPHGGKTPLPISIPVVYAQRAVNLPPDFLRDEKFLAFAGIARPQKFYDTCRSIGLALAGTEDFPDHHVFTKRELNRLQKRAGELGAKLLTTEKDWVRLPEYFQKNIMRLPMQIVFDDQQEIELLLNL
jgi:tetraacyldisaccharide 4'-kinase